MKTRHSLYFYGSERISGTEDRRPNIITKDVIMLLLLRKFHGFGSCDLGNGRRKIHISSYLLFICLRVVLQRRTNSNSMLELYL